MCKKTEKQILTEFKEKNMFAKYFNFKKINIFNNLLIANKNKDSDK